MLTNIAVDEELIIQALRLTGLKAEHDVVEIALKELIEHRRHDPLANAFGQLKWEGDLNAMRTDR